MEPGLILTGEVGLLSTQLAHLSEDGKALAGFFANIRSERTRSEYTQTLKEFLSLFQGEIQSPRDIKKHHIAHYRNLLDQKLAPNTVNKKMSALSSFCKYLTDPAVALMDYNPCYGVTRAEKENVKDTGAFTKDQVKMLFASLDPKKYNFYFNRAFLGIGFYAGLRVNEICNLRRENLGTENSVRVLKFKGKRRSTRRVSLHPIVGHYIDEHIDDLKKRGFDMDDPKSNLFPNLRNPTQKKPISRAAGNYLFQALLTKAGVARADDIRRFSTHSMRATFVTRLSELDVPIDAIQRELGHVRPETTQLYIKRHSTAEKSPVFRLDY